MSHIYLELITDQAPLALLERIHAYAFSARDRELLESLTSVPQLSPELHHALKTNPDPLVRASWVQQNFRLVDELNELSAELQPQEVLRALAGTPGLIPESYRNIVKNGDCDSLSSMAYNTSVPADILVELTEKIMKVQGTMGSTQLQAILERSPRSLDPVIRYAHSTSVIEVALTFLPFEYDAQALLVNRLFESWESSNFSNFLGFVSALADSGQLYQKYAVQVITWFESKNAAGSVIDFSSAIARLLRAERTLTSDGLDEFLVKCSALELLDIAKKALATHDQDLISRLGAHPHVTIEVLRLLLPAINYSDAGSLARHHLSRPQHLAEVITAHQHCLRHLADASDQPAVLGHLLDSLSWDSPLVQWVAANELLLPVDIPRLPSHVLQDSTSNRVKLFVSAHMLENFSTDEHWNAFECLSSNHQGTIAELFELVENI